MPIGVRLNSAESLTVNRITALPGCRPVQHRCTGLPTHGRQVKALQAGRNSSVMRGALRSGTTSGSDAISMGYWRSTDYKNST